jgi:transposase-like protein
LTTVPPSTILEFLSVWEKDNYIARRNKIPIEKKVMAVILCASGHSYRDASRILGGISHVAVYDAVKAATSALPRLERKRRLVAIEENVVHLNSETQGVVWMARDVESGEILAFRCSMTKSPQDGKKFIDSVLAVCTERPLLRVGRGPNFPHSLRSLDLYFQIDTSATPMRQRISDFFLGNWEPNK